MALGSVFAFTQFGSLVNESTVALAGAAVQISGQGATWQSRGRLGIVLANMTAGPIYVGGTNTTSPTKWLWQIPSGQTQNIGGNGSAVLYAYGTGNMEGAEAFV